MNKSDSANKLKWTLVIDDTSFNNKIIQGTLRLLNIESDAWINGQELEVYNELINFNECEDASNEWNRGNKCN